MPTQPNTANFERITLSIDKEVVDWLRSFADAENRSISNSVETLIKRAMNNGAKINETEAALVS